jgi:threonine/homoserine/homoserine lactone efflux protein
LVLLYAGGLVLGATVTVSLLLIRVLEFTVAVVIPSAGCAVLLWFAYKLLLQPVLRQRKLDRIRDYRARRDGSSQGQR